MISTQTTIKYVIFALRLPLKRDKNDMVSQMARAKYLGEPFMAHLENLYNIPCILYVLLIMVNVRTYMNKQFNHSIRSMTVFSMCLIPIFLLATIV